MILLAGIVTAPQSFGQLPDPGFRATPEYLTPASLPSMHLYRLATALGDRLFKSGKEVVRLSGTLTTKSTSSTRNLEVIWQSPGTFSIVDSSERRTLTFDGTALKSPSGTPTPEDVDLAETLTQDMAEPFLLAIASQASIQYIGSRFQLDTTPVSARAAGPFYDVFQLAQPARVRAANRTTHKLFLFDSDSQLLRRVAYDQLRNGSPLRVITAIDNWRILDGQRLPGRISREENGNLVWQFEISTATVAAKVTNAPIF